MKIIITATNGFMGKALVNYFKKEHQVIALQRNTQANETNVKYFIWDGKTIGTWAQEFEGADVVINLAGKSVDCRYNEKNKAEIFSSRLESTAIIGKAIEKCAVNPKIWINAASATIYQHSFVPMTEKDGIIGSGFSVEVCKAWEKAFNDFNHLNIRQIALRTAIVLGSDGGVMVPFKNLSKFGLGGKMGDGKQMFSWIHILDICRAIEFFIQHENTQGVYNLAAPNPISNKEFMQALRKQYKRPFGITLPKFLLEIGARIIQTETELILKSRYVIPERLLEAGFEFEYNTISKALKEIN